MVTTSEEVLYTLKETENKTKIQEDDLLRLAAKGELSLVFWYPWSVYIDRFTVKEYNGWAVLPREAASRFVGCQQILIDRFHNAEGQEYFPATPYQPPEVIAISSITGRTQYSDEVPAAKTSFPCGREVIRVREKDFVRLEPGTEQQAIEAAAPLHEMPGSVTVQLPYITKGLEAIFRVMRDNWARYDPKNPPKQTNIALEIDDLLGWEHATDGGPSRNAKAIATLIQPDEVKAKRNRTQR